MKNTVVVASAAQHPEWRLATFALFILLNVSSAVCQSSSAIPACPSGSQSVQWKDSKGHRVFSCKFPGKVVDDLEQCAEWEGTEWSKTATVPCGSSVSHVVEQNPYEQQLGCPASRQVYMWNSAAKKLDDRKTCLPVGWEIRPSDGDCPAGYQAAAVGNSDICVGRPKQAARPVRPSNSKALYCKVFSPSRTNDGREMYVLVTVFPNGTKLGVSLQAQQPGQISTTQALWEGVFTQDSRTGVWYSYFAPPNNRVKSGTLILNLKDPKELALEVSAPRRDGGFSRLDFSATCSTTPQ